MTSEIELPDGPSEGDQLLGPGLDQVFRDGKWVDREDLEDAHFSGPEWQALGKQP